jgi:hypothetical protein
MDYMVSVQLFSSALGSQKQPEKMSKWMILVVFSVNLYL